MILEMAEAIPLAELQFTMSASEDLRMSRRPRVFVSHVAST